MRLALALLCCVYAAPALPPGRPVQPSVTLTASSERVVLLENYGGPEPCPSCNPTPMPVELAAATRSLQGRKLTYIYTVTGGKILGEGARVRWDLSGLKPGVYSVRVRVRGRRGRGVTDSKQVTVEVCRCIRESFP